MSAANHTPGPWEAELDGSFATRVRATNPDGNKTKGRTIATTYCQNIPKTFEANLTQGKVNEANARLIAAAPELLAALQTACGCIELERQIVIDSCQRGDGSLDADGAAEVEEFDCILTAARAAIVKATGEAP